jgi:hypothetical protein
VIKTNQVAFGNATINQAQVFEWVYYFKEGQISIKSTSILDAFQQVKMMNL